MDVDPLAEVISLLRPRAVFSKGIAGAGAWAVSYGAFGHPGFCAVIEGQCRLAVAGEPPALLAAGDFVLLPATPAFTIGSLAPATPRHIVPRIEPEAAGEVRHGRRDGPPDVRMQGGYFIFDSPDAAMIVSLLPAMIHIHGDAQLAALVGILGAEAARPRPGRGLILTRLVEVLLVAALRATEATDAPPGLLRGLGDPRVSEAIRRMHGELDRPWTVAALARAAGQSRSAFFERFTRTVGLRPMEYLLAWRMAVAKDLLRAGAASLDEVARRVGYGSASTFSTAFSRHVGQPPGRFARLAGLTLHLPSAGPSFAGVGGASLCGIACSTQRSTTSTNVASTVASRAMK